MGIIENTGWINLFLLIIQRIMWVALQAPRAACKGFESARLDELLVLCGGPYPVKAGLFLDLQT
jgi:hypothetical protein